MRQRPFTGNTFGESMRNGKPVTGRDLRAAIDALLNGRTVDPKQTPSIGCNIKWR
jgi:hypothetical protein